MTDQRSPIEAALDLVLYAPVGLALTIGEELPKLAAKGRSDLGARVATARTVGQFAVAQGRREMTRRFGSQPGPGPAPAPAPRAQPGAPTGPTSPVRASTPSRPVTAAGRRGPAPAGSSPAGSAPAPSAPAPSAPAPSAPPAAPAVASLAIPGYDSLSASQVVQRLAGLSGPELQAVKEYEAASRGRRTILARVGQLQGN